MVSIDFYPCQAIVRLSNPLLTTTKQCHIKSSRESEMSSHLALTTHLFVLEGSSESQDCHFNSVVISHTSSSLLGQCRNEPQSPTTQKYPQHNEVAGGHMRSSNRYSHPSQPGKSQLRPSREPEKSLTTRTAPSP